MSAASASYAYAGSRPGIVSRFLGSRFVAVIAVSLAILAIWYVVAVLLNAPEQRQLDENTGAHPGFVEFVQGTWNQKRPLLPSPHQIAQELYKSVILLPPTSKRRRWDWRSMAPASTTRFCRSSVARRSAKESSSCERRVSETLR